MSNPYLSRVQQKMTHCGMALEACHHASSGQLRESHLQAAVLHLAIACRLYLRELAYSLQVPMPERIYTPQDLEELSEAGPGTQEILAKPSVVSLLDAEKTLLNPSVGAQPAIIGGASTAKIDLTEVERWRDEVSELIERQRQSFLEY